MKHTNTILRTGLLTLLASAALFFNSCKEDDNTNNNPTPAGGYKGVFVINEGGFLKGNASVDFYSTADANFTENLFTKANSRPLGDIFQSMTKTGTKFYLVVNNSQKIEVVSADNFTSTGTINNLGSPRFMQPVANNTKAYVTDLFSGQIDIIDLATAAKTGSIHLPGWNEHMVEVGTEVYVNNWSGKKVYEINTASNTVTDSIVLTGAPNGLVKDANGKLWVLVDSAGANKARLVRINPANNQTETSIEFAGGETASKMAINGAGTKLYYLKANGVYEVDITATTLPATAKKQGSFYGLGVDPSDGSVYVSDALDFNQKGVVYRIKPDGSESNFKAGIAPSGFFFNY